MSLPRFTLVHDPRTRKSKHPERLTGSSAGQAKTLRKVVRELESHPQRQIAGLWDLSSQVGELPDVIAYLNEAQSGIAFYEVQASVPAGLASRPERIAKRIEEHQGGPLAEAELSELAMNIFFKDFEGRAERIRKDLGIDYLIGITPYMVAFEDSDGVHWNYFSSFGKRIVLASTYDVDKYARKARRPFEAAVAGIAVSQLLAAMNPKIDYHTDTRGCIFDKNESRDSIVKSLEMGSIDDECMKLIQPRYRDTARSLVEALRRYPGGGGDRT